MPVTLVRSRWASGTLIFHESTSRDDAYNLLTLSTTEVIVGNASQDVDLKVFLGSATEYVLFDVGNSRVDFGVSGTGVDVRLFGDTAGADMVWDQNGDTNGSLTLGADTKSVDFRAYGVTTGKILHWDGSADALYVDGLIAPKTTGTCALGSGTLMFSDLFLASAGVINWNNGDVTMTHAANALTLAGGTLNVATSGSPYAFTAGTPAFTLYTTNASESGATNAEPFLVYNTQTGSGGVGGRAKFYTTANVVLGGWANALKSHMNFGSSGRVTGLASSMCVEMDLPNANLGSGGAYYPLEVELNPGASTVSAGSPSGNQVGFIYMSVNTNKADFDDHGFFFRIGGLTSEAGHVFLVGAPDTLAASLRVIVGTTAYYLPLYANQAVG